MSMGQEVRMSSLEDGEVDWRTDFWTSTCMPKKIAIERHEHGLIR
jgi:hypothetical protein